MAQILDGKWVRDQILADWKPHVDELIRTHRPPGLAVVLAGNDPGSEIYVRNKVKASQDIGIHSEKITPPETVTTDELLAIVEELNERPDIARHPRADCLFRNTLIPAASLLTVRLEKDVDGFHPMNVGNLVANIPSARPARRPASSNC